MDKRTQIVLMANEIRNAFQGLVPNNSIFGGKFPTGFCMNACDLLAKYLEQNGILTTLITGQHKCLGTHAWLEYQETLIIDITADQFSGNGEEVIVTTIRDWHMQFSERTRSPNYDFLKVHSPIMGELILQYNRIVESNYLTQLSSKIII